MHKYIEEIHPSIYRVSLSIPVPLKAINIYLFKGATGWSIVDCGFHDKESEIVWNQVFRDLHIDYDEVSQIIVTHYHPDHYGGAGWLQELTGAKVFLLDKEKKFLDRAWHDKTFPSYLHQAFLNYGMPENIALDVKEEHISRYQSVSPHPQEITLLSAGDEIELGDYCFQTIWSPGHTEGLMTLWSESESIFIANDLVLPKITPNISFYGITENNPLSDFFDSLRKIRDLPAKMVLPGHRQIITNLGERVDEIIHHHDERLDNIKNILKYKQESNNNSVSGWEISSELFGALKEPVQHRFAFAETLAHLEYLRHANELKKIKIDGRYFYYI